MLRVGTVVRCLAFIGLLSMTLAFGKTNQGKTIVTYPSEFGVSQRLADLPIELNFVAGQEMPEPKAGPLGRSNVAGQWEDPIVQKQLLPQFGGAKLTDFEGITSNGYAPSDSNMAVGPNHIVETVNVLFAIYNKSGALLAGPTNIQNLFTGLGLCSSTYGDPVVLYDRAADRWVISYIGGAPAECVAVSKTNDPTGAYYIYGYSFAPNLNDYPKLSTWATASNSAYLASYNIFVNGQSYGGADLCGFDRTKMLAGDKTAAQLCQMTPSNEFTYLPGDMDGPTPPVDGTPGLFINWQGSNPGKLYLRQLTLNFAAGTATLSSPTAITVSNFTPACGGGTCIQQLGTSQRLDSLGDRMMYRFAIRHFPDHDRAVVSHSVGNGSSTGVRWYELYDPAGAVTLNQQGTFAPDNNFRWMGSIAEDQASDIAIGYSVSSSSMNPAIRFSGRTPSDPLGTMESELSIIEGTGSQLTGLSRWGDYTAMQVDPSDDCTFWYVDQYEQTSGTFNWHTHIGAFSFANCSGSPTFTLGANPGSLSIAQGSQGTSTITVTDVNGFSGSVNLAASGLPSGVTAGFNPNPTTTTSTMTLTVASGAATGTSTITISGTSGSITGQTTLQLTVTQAAGQPVVTLTPTSLTFAKTVVGKTSAAKTITMSNSGTGTLNISSITASGDFAISSTTCGAALAVSASCKIKVTFTPTQLGTRTGAVTISDNAGNSPQTVALTGVGAPQATLSPAKATYIGTKVGTTSAAKTFTLANKQSSASLTGISPSTTGDFAISGTTCGATLAPLSSCTISVVFQPTQVGTRTGTLQVSDSAVGSPQVSALTGTGK
jgi:hypothetical protein